MTKNDLTNKSKLFLIFHLLPDYPGIYPFNFCIKKSLFQFYCLIIEGILFDYAPIGKFIAHHLFNDIFVDETSIAFVFHDFFRKLRI